MPWILAHSTVILMVLLTLSELLGAVAPSGWGGVIAFIIQTLKSFGAKDIDQK